MEDGALPRKYVTIGHSVGANVESAPFLRDSFSEAGHGRLRSGIVGLADVAVEACDGGNVDDGTVGEAVVSLKVSCQISMHLLGRVR